MYMQIPKWLQFAIDNRSKFKKKYAQSMILRQKSYSER